MSLKPELFPDVLDLTVAGFRNGSALFRVSHYYRYISSLGEVCVPTGFITDGASIPRVFWSALSPFGDYFPAALIHDFLYSPRNTRYTRLQADTIFLEAMCNLGVAWYRRNTIYRAVRMFGGFVFRGGPVP